MISLVFPTYNEQENLEELYRRLDAETQRLKAHKFEFIFIDDGSRDRTPEILKSLHERDTRVKVIRLAHNFGSHAALAAGLINCHGDCVINMASDLQDPPEFITLLVEEWKKGISKIIWGVRAARQGERKRKKIFAKLYYMLVNWLTDVKVPPSGADVFLADRVVVEAYRGMQEKHTSVFMALAWLGFPRAEIEYIRKPRHAGKSKWTFAKQIKLTLDSILSFSDIPIRYMSMLGIAITFLGFIYTVSIVWDYFHGSPVQGWSSLIVAILVVGGIQMMMLGVLGEYIWRTYDESRKRPKFVIEYMLG